MKYLSLFSGIGGFELGIQQAYVDSINRSKNGGEQKDQKIINEERERLFSATGKKTRTAKGHVGQHYQYVSDIREPACVGYSEIDKYAIQIYQKHFPDHKNYGDITKINASELPNFDLIVGGFPCQSFSIAGKRGGFNDTRGTLFFDIARIIRKKQPRFLLLENVKGLLSHDEGRTFATIITTLDELGYDLQWQVLNSKDFGVPQNRERVFIVGHFRGIPRPEVFPFKKTNGAVDEGFSTDDTKSEVASTLRSRYGNGTGSHIVPTIRATQYKSGDNQTTVAEQKMKIRRLTPIECERLQGFPDNWTKYGIEKKIVDELYDISDTQRYKCLGNAVTVNVVREICKRLFK